MKNRTIKKIEHIKPIRIKCKTFLVELDTMEIDRMIKLINRKRTWYDARSEYPELNDLKECLIKLSK